MSGRWLSVLLAALLVVGPRAGSAEATGPSASPGALSVSSDPAGAAVYVDGRFRGQTPLDIEELPAGDHRVRVVKGGYLENRRVVHVRPSRKNTFDVRLTRNDATEAAPPLQVEPEESRRGRTKWLLIGAGVLGAGAAALLLLGKNGGPPSPGTVVVTPSDVGLEGATVFTFTSQGASDPDGDPLTFSWEFGDGSSGSGQTATHTYAASGSFTATLIVSDGRTSATTTAAVTVRNLTGNWSGTSSGFPFSFSLQHINIGVTGSYVDELGRVPTTGSVPSQRRVQLTVSARLMTFTGTVDSRVNTITGTVVFDFGSAPFTMSRR